MPKASPIQPSFSGGEFSPKVFGRVDSERYKTGLATCLNYLPTTQGPIVRRPGFRYVSDAKDPSKPPAFLEFKFSQTQNYVIEAGDKYFRFFANEGELITSSTNFKVSGDYGPDNVAYLSSHFYALRTDPLPSAGETIRASSVISSGSIVEIETPYSYTDVSDIKWAQREDTLYLVHSSYPEYKLQRFGHTSWTLKRVQYNDGPYLPFNSYKFTGDSTRITIIPGSPAIIYNDGSLDYDPATTGPIRVVTGTVSTGSSQNYIRLTSAAHGFKNGDLVVVKNVFGTTEANNGTSSVFALTWRVENAATNTLDLHGSVYSNAYVGSGTIQPALWQGFGSPVTFGEAGRNIGLIRMQDGGRAWGTIIRAYNACDFSFHLERLTSPPFAGSSVAAPYTDFWQLSPWSGMNGYPGAVCFHQDRHFLAGIPAFPQKVVSSASSDYENFQNSGSSLITTDSDGLNFNVNSDQLNRVQWLKSDAQGLLAGSFSAEWKISPSNEAGVLTPSTVNAAQTSFFGSATSDAVQTGNATLYMQRAQKKLRELNYFFQVNTYRSTDLTELSEHITNPGVVKLAVQKEPIPTVWGLRSDGQLVSMGYSRDDVTLKAGWARHELGGKSGLYGGSSIVKAMAVIPSSDGSYDQVWVAVKRFINGTSVLNIECSQKLYDNKTRQEDAVYLDAAGSYDNPITISNIINSSVIDNAAAHRPALFIKSTAHGLSNLDLVSFSGIVGLNTSVIDVNGLATTVNLLDGRTLFVNVADVDTFIPIMEDTDSVGITSLSLPAGYNVVQPTGYDSYISGGTYRELVSTVSGLTWLKNETVDVLADGGIHPTTIVNSAGVLALSYPAATVQVGLKYRSDGKTLRPEAGSADGSSIGKLRRTVRAAIQVHESGDLKIGTNFDRLTPVEFNQGPEADTAPALFSGIVRESVEGEYDFEGQVCFRQEAPLPGMIQSITKMIEENDV